MFDPCPVPGALSCGPKRLMNGKPADRGVIWKWGSIRCVIDSVRKGVGCAEHGLSRAEDVAAGVGHVKNSALAVGIAFRVV